MPPPHRAALEDAEIRRWFTSLDKDKSGLVHAHELEAGLKAMRIPRKYRRPKAGADELAEVEMPSMNEQEFIGYVKAREADVGSVFNELDVNGDGVLCENDVGAALEGLGIDAAREDVHYLMEALQTAHGGSDSGDELVVDFVTFRKVAVLMPAISTKSVTRTWLNYAPAAMRHGGLPPDAKAGDSQTLATVGKNLLCGAIAGAVSRTCTAPLDRLKMIMQAGGGVQGSFKGKYALRGAMRDLYRDGGILGFWRGNGTNVIKIMPESGVKFMAYDMAKSILCADKDNPKFGERFLSGSVAGLTSQFVIYPMDIVKTRLGISASGQYTGMVDCFAKTIRKEGALAVYKGLGPALVGIVPAVGIDMAIYNHLKDEYRAYRIQQSALQQGEQTDGEGVVVSLSCGAVSSVCGAIASYPLVVARTKLMAQGMPGRPMRYTGAIDCLCQIWKEDGVRGLYRGQIPSLMKTIPSVSIGYAVYDVCRSMFGMPGI